MSKRLRTFYLGFKIYYDKGDYYWGYRFLGKGRYALNLGYFELSFETWEIDI